MNKLIVLDSGFLTHRQIFLWGSSKKKALEVGDQKDPIPASHGYVNAIYSTLKRIGVDKNDKVLIAKDGWNSWRKAFYPVYKAQRKEYRDSHQEIDWKKQYKIINNVERKLHQSTNWNFLQLNNVFNFADLSLTTEGKELNIVGNNIDYSIEYGIEADDLMAICPKIFPNLEVILVTIDKDVSQCLHYDNCKIFNPNLRSTTNKAKKGYYVIEDDPLGVIQKKVKSGDKSDNIIVDKKNDTEREVEIRQLIIDMLHMPKWLEDPIVDSINNLNWNKKTNHAQLPFQNSLGKKFNTIYDKSQVRTFEESLQRHKLYTENKKKKQREAYRKRKQKKEKQNV